MKYIITSILLITISLFVSAQSIDEIKADRQTYIWGEGKGTTLKKAQNEALSMIIGQISTEVESSFTLLKTEETENDEVLYKESVESVVNTYSNASLKNTEQILISNEPDAHVFRYIKRADLYKIFEDRKNKIIGFAENGTMSLENLQIADALRYYYWALTLLHSHPDASSIKIITNKGEEKLLSTWLPFQIKQILVGIDVQVSELEDMGNYKQALLNISWNGKPVRNFDYSYFDGRNWSNTISAKDGLGYIELPSTFDKDSKIDIKTEYFFEAEAAIDNELRDVMKEIEPIPFRDAYTKISITDEKSFSFTVNNGQKETYEELDASVEETNSYEESVNKICSAITKNDYVSVKDQFTDDGYKIYTELLQYGQAGILDNHNLNFIDFGDKIVCRSVKMKFNFSNNTRSFVEDVVFVFDKTGKVSDITFGLDQTAVNDILKHDQWSESVRLNLIDFMEHYKTAFALKRLDYIEQIFSDDALIITGWVVKTKPNPEQPYLNNQIVKYNRLDKQTYLKNLSYSFQSKEFINLKFNDNNIRKSGKGGEVYGIQIQQDYFSSNYGDSGYLFLLIDMNDTTQPIIHVRTWQPEKNADGTIYGVGDF